MLVEGIVSDSQPVPSGVPQGSVLGTLFFSVYISDLGNIASNILTFADDTKLFRMQL